MKRTDYISWEECFMAVALTAAQRSKDPSTQVGACIVNRQQRIVGVGYNGFPNGCSDDMLPWDGKGDFLDTKYPYVCHAEKNAIFNSTGNLEGATIYVTLFPCNVCAQDVIQSGIKSVVYLSDKYHDREFTVAARKLFDLAGITYTEFKPCRPHLKVNFIEEKND